VVALVLSRLLGPAGFGAYSFAFAWASVLAIPAVLGLNFVLVRKVAAYKAHERWPELRGLLRRANQAVLGTSLVLAGGAALISVLLGFPDEELRWPFLIGLTLVPISALSIVRLSTLQGLGHVVLARLPETIVAPAAFLGLVALVAVAGSSFSASWAIGLQSAGWFLAFVLGAILLRARIPRAVTSVAPAYEMRSWVRSAVPMLLVGALATVNFHAGTIALGVAADSAEVGIYTVATRIAMLVGFLSAAAMFPLMPAVARLHATHEHERLRILLPRSAQVVLLLSLPVAIAFLVLPGLFLGIFGSGYGEGGTVLRVLVVGELLKLVLGSASMALAMGGLEGQVLKGAAAGAVTDVVLLAVLVPPFGGEGAAVALAVSALAANGVFAYLAWTRLGLYTPALRVPGLAR
jgi:O-antigen/teichoic acid export membrane protein